MRSPLKISWKAPLLSGGRQAFFQLARSMLQWLIQVWEPQDDRSLPASVINTLSGRIMDYLHLPWSKQRRLGHLVRFYHLDKPQFWLPEVSNTFHGRDIFSPVAAHLAAGTPIEQMGSLIDDPVRLVMPQPVRTDTGWRGQVVLIDVFGNIATNLAGELVKTTEKVTLRIADQNGRWSGQIIR